jgi:excisionase family DNA binding protein
MAELERGDKRRAEREPSDDELLTVDEVATLLKINPQTVRNRIEGGELPAVRLGRRVRVQRSVLQQLIGWHHGDLIPPEVTQPLDSATEHPLDLEAAAAALEQIGTGFIKLGAAIRTDRPKASRKRER